MIGSADILALQRAKRRARVATWWALALGVALAGSTVQRILIAFEHRDALGELRAKCTERTP